MVERFDIVVLNVVNAPESAGQNSTSATLNKPVLLVGSRASIPGEIASLGMPAHDFLSTPWDAEELLVRCCKLLSPVSISALPVERDGPAKVVIADDDPAILRLVSTILEKEGFVVVGARDGREAYRILQGDQSFAAAVLDVVMPHISGPELVRYMKTEKRLMRIPVMMMTAEQDPKLSSDSFAAGAVVFLPKPFTTAQLQIMLQMLIAKAGD